MGAYRYVKTTTLADVVWKDREGNHHQDRVAIAIYAYKPYSNWGADATKANREMEFSTVTPWRSAWTRKGVTPPRLAVMGEQDKATREVRFRIPVDGTGVWSTGGVAFIDDHNTPVGHVVNVIKVGS